MAPRANQVIELSDDSDREIARRAPAARPKAFKSSNKTSRFTDKRSAGAIIDLTDDNIQHSDSPALPKRSQAKSPAPTFRHPKARDTVPPLVVQKTDIDSAKSKDASPPVHLTRDESGLSDGLSAKAAALRISSDAKPNGWDTSMDGLRGSSQKSSLKKRRRDDENNQRPNTTAKHRRVATSGEEDRPASIGNAIPREAVTSTKKSSRPATNSPTRSGATDDRNASEKPKHPLQNDLSDSSSTRLTPRPSGPHTGSKSFVRDLQHASRQSSLNPEGSRVESSVQKPRAKQQTVPSKTAKVAEKLAIEHFEAGLSNYLKRNGENGVEAAQKKTPGLKGPDPKPNDGCTNRPPETPLQKVSVVEESPSAGASPSSQLRREAAGEDREKPGNDEQVLQHDTQDDLPASHDLLDTAPIVAPDLSVLPVEKQVERILGKYYQEMREDTDYHTKLQLKRSRRSVELHVDTHAGSGKPSVASSVFARLRASAAMQPTTLSAKIGDGSVKFNVDVYNGATNRSTRSYTKVKTTYCDVTSLANDVPEYAHYVSLKSNVLAPNTKTMTVWPYFGDGAPDPEEFEDHYFMDTDQRHRKIGRLLEAQKVEEYVESALRDLQISWNDVLQVLLDVSPNVGKNAMAQAAIKNINRKEFLEDFPRVQGSKKWMKILSSLPSSTTEKLTKAAILCDHFQSIAKFPLWHVARRSAAVKQAFESQEPPASSIDSRTCRFCFQFNCHQHGELREDNSDTDSGVETDDAVSKDVLYPPRVNFRKRVSLPHRPLASEDDSLATIRKKMVPKYWDSSLFTKPGEWPPFYPCYHPGLTCNQAECSCFLDKRPCEKSCECSDDCARKFKGCSCSATAKKSGGFVCYVDGRCACYAQGRECDADLCGSCGVCEMLDPVHRRVDGDSRKRCSNASLQKGVPKHTLLGDSGVHGMGLYAGEHIKKHEFVGEYKGEVITNGEADRRGAVYEKQNSTYLFSLNTRQEVDSNFYGNKIRFINHRNRGGANLYPLIVLVNSVHRIGLFAQQDIKPGEELFFDYGPKFPEHLLGGTKQAVSKSAPHVRNANLLEKFYDIQDEEDEDGNVRARKAPASSKRGRARKADPVAKPVKPKGKMGGARPGAGRKPGKKRAVQNGDAATSAGGSSKAAVEDGLGEDEVSRVRTQEQFDTFYVSQDLGLTGGGGDDEDDEDFDVGAGASESESSSEEESDFEDDEFEDTGRGRRVRKRPWKLED
jgi:hypothetical protein